MLVWFGSSFEGCGPAAERGESAGVRRSSRWRLCGHALRRAGQRPSMDSIAVPDGRTRTFRCSKSTNSRVGCVQFLVVVVGDPVPEVEDGVDVVEIDFDDVVADLQAEEPEILVLADHHVDLVRRVSGDSSVHNLAGCACHISLVGWLVSECSRWVVPMCERTNHSPRFLRGGDRVPRL